MILRAPPPDILSWYFNAQRKLGDIQNLIPTAPYGSSRAAGMRTNFSNCPAHVLAPGLSHVAVGFVDLGMLLDSDFLSRAHETAACFQFRGIEASPFAVAKSLVLWEMLQTVGTKEKWIVQVWFSSVWSVSARMRFWRLPSASIHACLAQIIHHRFASWCTIGHPRKVWVSRSMPSAKH